MSVVICIQCAIVLSVLIVNNECGQITRMSGSSKRNQDCGHGKNYHKTTGNSKDFLFHNGKI